MSKNPFIILGVDENIVNQNELFEAYRAIRAKYAEERFAEGEKGERAARMVSDIDQAYSDAKAILESKVSIADTGDIYAGIESLIKDGNYEEAQHKLDAISERSAEWNYYQAIVYYQKGWYFEAKKQLEMAVSKDSGNPKYKEKLDKLNEKINGTDSNTAQQTQNTEGTFRSYGGERPRNSSDSACNCCSSLICADCCCECMGGDLIRCC